MTLNECFWVCVQKDTRAYLLLLMIFFLFLIFGIGYRAILFFVDVTWVFVLSFFWDTRHAVGLVTLGIGYVRSVPNLLLLLRSEG